MLLSGRVPNSKSAALQISKYVEREILNHKRLNHPHIVELKEVSTAARKAPWRAPMQSLPLPASQQHSRTKWRIHVAWQAAHACPAAAHLLAGGPGRPLPLEALTWSPQPCPPPCLQVFLTPEFLAIAMEYAAGGDMFQLVVRQRGLPEADARWYFQQLIIAIDYCHRMVSLRAVCQLRGR